MAVLFILSNIGNENDHFIERCLNKIIYTCHDEEIPEGALMRKHSAGLLLYRWRSGGFEVLLVHPGGPFWAGKDGGAWSIPKGEYPPDEDPLAAAYREFNEETSCLAEGEVIPLRPLKQPSGKVIQAWALEGDCDADAIRSNTFSLEWPPRSGQRQDFPEVDRAAWFSLEAAREKILKGQVGFIDELEEILASRVL
jgi:predicted NUDIX family NTP pyrophosphohydrolase